MIFVSCLWTFVSLVLATAYITLFERYIMATVQRRVGPDYILLGIVQPLLDGLKLLSNDYMSTYRIWDTVYFYFVIILLLTTVISWCMFCWDSFTYIIFLGLSVLWFLLCASLGVYTIILSGLSGGCRFSLLGTFRFIFQLVTFEINFSLLVLIIGGYILGFSMMNVLTVSRLHIPLLCYGWLLVYFMLMGMIETARVPFDLPESESELVSGYNTEYSSFLFALLFLGEYGSIFVFGGLIIVVLGGSLTGVIKLFLTSLLAGLIVASRCIYARLRYYTVVVIGWLHMIWFGLAVFVLLELCLIL